MADFTLPQRYFEDIAVGDEFEETQQPTHDRVVAFIKAVKLANEGGRFTDPERAKAMGLEHPLVPGVMSVSILTRFVNDWMAPLGRVLSLDVSFRRPVYHDDVLRCVAVVIDVDGDDDDFEGAESGAVSLDITLENARSEKPVQGTAVVELPRRR